MSLTEEIKHYYDNITPFEAAMIFSLILLYILHLYLKDMNLPPGPKGLPLFGYWPFLKEDTCHLQLQELIKKYGDVFSFRGTGRLFIHLGSLKAIKEAHVTKSECFGARFSDENILHFIFGEGIIFMNGEQHKVLRKFFVFKLKEYGMNAVKENAAGEIYDTIKETVEELRRSKGRPVQINDLITMKCMMIIRRILFNDGGITSEELQEIIELYGEIMKAVTGTNMLLTGKLAKYFIHPFMPRIRTLKRCHRRINAIFYDIVNRHKAEYNESQVADIIDCYFKERDERLKKGDPTAACLTDKALVNTLGQFLADGALSIGAFIGYVLMKLLEYPDEHEKIYKEILEVIGQDRLPTLEDKTKLHYTNAFIHEVIRLSDFFPMFPSLECTKETNIHGYKIPKGSITILNMYAANHNTEDFENADEFNPSRYIATAEKRRAELPLLFGAGKRACIGETFSMIQTFLFLTTIVQNFRLSLPEGSQGSFMFSAPEKAKICFYPRYQKSI